MGSLLCLRCPPGLYPSIRVVPFGDSFSPHVVDKKSTSWTSYFSLFLTLLSWVPSPGPLSLFTLPSDQSSTSVFCRFFNTISVRHRFLRRRLRTKTSSWLTRLPLWPLSEAFDVTDFTHSLYKQVLLLQFVDSPSLHPSSGPPYQCRGVLVSSITSSLTFLSFT